MNKVTGWVTLLVFSVFVRIAVYNGTPAYLATADTASYYATARNIIATGILTDPWRTPGYPLFLALPFILTGKRLPETYYGHPMPEFVALGIVQSAAGVISVLLLYKILLDIGLKRKLAWVFGILAACTWPLLVYEHILLTETLSTLLLVATVSITVNAMRRWSMGKGIALAVLFVIGVFLRPGTILLPLLFICFLVWYHRKRAVVVWAIAAVVFYTGILLTYSRMNEKYFSYRGISRISDVNLLGKILSYRLPPDLVAPGEINDIVTRAMGGAITDPWVVYAQNLKLYDVRYAAPMHDFATKVLRRNVGTYVFRSLTEIPGALTGWHMLFFVGAPASLYALWKKKTLFTAGMALFSGIGLYYIGTAVFLSYNDYGRLLVPALPFLFVVSYGWLYQAAIWIKR